MPKTSLLYPFDSRNIPLNRFFSEGRKIGKIKDHEKVSFIYSSSKKEFMRAPALFLNAI